MIIRFGSHELKKEFLEPSVLGDKVRQHTCNALYMAHFNHMPLVLFVINLLSLVFLSLTCCILYYGAFQPTNLPIYEPTYPQVACLGVSEPGGGSDVAAATTTARRC